MDFGCSRLKGMVALKTNCIKNWDIRLKVTNVGWQDAGIYLCQLAVHPPSLIWTRLDIDPPVVHILDSEEAPVWELHYDVGTTVEMVCRVKRPPLQGKHYFYF